MLISLFASFEPNFSTLLLVLGLGFVIAGGMPRPVGVRTFLAVVALALLAGALAVDLLAPFAQPLLIVTVAILIRSTAPGFPEKRRPLFAVLAYGLLACAVIVPYFGTGMGQVLMLVTSGMGLLALQSYWAQAEARIPSSEGWEFPILASLFLASAYSSYVYSVDTGWVKATLPEPWLTEVTLIVTGIAIVVSLTAPVRAPAQLRTVRTTALDVATHGSVGIALLNVLFLSVSFAADWSLKVILAILLGWQLMVIGLEYRTIHHVQQRRQKPLAPPPSSTKTVTILVPAANEGHLLRQTVNENLAIDYPTKILLVPASKSTDDTVAVAHALAKEHPTRVQVVLGDTGSKAHDLNKAWEHVESEFVLMLDADETTDRDSILRAIMVFNAHPDVGLVQGRKVSRRPDERPLARFISAERRYCTWMDHVMHGEALGSGHFGGSAALVRTYVPPNLGGWTDETLTEDIEFTLRLHLDARYRIVYQPDMVVREADPETFTDLLRQRTRWSRGWAECFNLYFAKVLGARRTLGAKRSFGLGLLLLIAVSALWTTFVPATIIMRLGGISPLLPLAVAIPMSLVLLPSRLLAYGYAATYDPVIPLVRRPARWAELVLHAYVWIILGWFIQLHALYLELSTAPRVWHVTPKRSNATSDAAAARPVPVDA